MSLSTTVIPEDPGLADEDLWDESDKVDGMQRADGAPDGRNGTIPPPPKVPLGFILDEPDEKKVAKHITSFRTEAAPARSRRRAVWQRNQWWREGRRFVRLIKKQDTNQWEAKLPLGMGSAPPVPNRVDRLCRRLTNTVLVDKPYPECEPGDDSNEAKDAAEFSTRYLAELGAPGNLNMNAEVRAANDKAQTFASAFGWVKMDPCGDGWRPRRMLAHPGASHQQDALTDPASGMQANEADLKERYVRADGFLTDNPQEGDLQWLPAPKIRLLTGLQVDFIPSTCRGLRDADGLSITDVTSLGELKALFPDTFKAMRKEDIERLVKWKSDKLEDLLPPYTKPPADQKYEEGPKQGEYKDSQLVVVTTIYYKRCAEYPYGCYAVAGGEEFLLHRQKWSAMMLTEEGVAPTEEVLEIPVAQCRCLDDNTFDDPYGIGIVQEIGPADEIAASALGFELEHMFRAANPIPFIPMGSIVQPNQFLRRDGKPVITNPQGKPEWEQVPDLSPTVPLLRGEMKDDQNDGIGLQQAAQGVEDPSVQSGIHAQTIVQEALKAVMNIKDNTGDYYIAVNRIILQQSRAFCAVPTLLSYTGRDGEYKQKEWSRTDFRNTKKVSIAKGTYTMHTLLAKQEMAANALSMQVIDGEEYKELVSGGISPVLGVQDNPHLMRIRRQLDQWDDGPTPEWTAAMAAYPAQLEQHAAQEQERGQREAAVAEVIGMAPQPFQPQPPPPPPPDPFTDRLPVDDEPMPAKIRHRQLSRTMVSSKYQDFPPEWRAVLAREYAQAKLCAGVMTVPEVQAAKAAEQQQAQAAQAQQLATQQQGQQAEGARKDEELALRREEVGARVRQADAIARPPAAASAVPAGV